MIQETSRDTWVIADLRNERLCGYTLNILAKARELALAVAGRAAIIILEPPSLTPVAQHWVDDHLRAFLITIDPKQIHKPVAYKHEGEEFIFVLEGELELTLGSKTHLLLPWRVDPLQFRHPSQAPEPLQRRDPLPRRPIYDLALSCRMNAD